jgi:hypothetical protein
MVRGGPPRGARGPRGRGRKVVSVEQRDAQHQRELQVLSRRIDRLLDLDDLRPVVSSTRRSASDVLSELNAGASPAIPDDGSHAKALVSQTLTKSLQKNRGGSTAAPGTRGSGQRSDGEPGAPRVAVAGVDAWLKRRGANQTSGTQGPKKTQSNNTRNSSVAPSGKRRAAGGLGQPSRRSNREPTPAPPAQRPNNPLESRAGKVPKRSTIRPPELYFESIPVDAPETPPAPRTLSRTQIVREPAAAAGQDGAEPVALTAAGTQTAPEKVDCATSTMASSPPGPQIQPPTFSGRGQKAFLHEDGGGERSVRAVQSTGRDTSHFPTIDVSFSDSGQPQHSGGQAGRDGELDRAFPPAHIAALQSGALDEVLLDWLRDSARVPPQEQPFQRPEVAVASGTAPVSATADVPLTSLVEKSLVEQVRAILDANNADTTASRESEAALEQEKERRRREAINQRLEISAPVQLLSDSDVRVMELQAQARNASPPRFRDRQPDKDQTLAETPARAPTSDVSVQVDPPPVDMASQTARSDVGGVDFDAWAEPPVAEADQTESHETNPPADGGVPLTSDALRDIISEVAEVTLRAYTSNQAASEQVEDGSLDDDLDLGEESEDSHVEESEVSPVRCEMATSPLALSVASLSDESVVVDTETASPPPRTKLEASVSSSDDSVSSLSTTMSLSEWSEGEVRGGFFSEGEVLVLPHSQRGQFVPVRVDRLTPSDIKAAREKALEMAGGDFSFSASAGGDSAPIHESPDRDRSTRNSSGGGDSDTSSSSSASASSSSPGSRSASSSAEGPQSPGALDKSEGEL